MGRATASSDRRSAATPSRISTRPPIAMITPPTTNAKVTQPYEFVSIIFPNVQGAAIATPVPHAEKRAIAIARVSIGKISLTVRYAADAPLEAKKKQTAQQTVNVVADRCFVSNAHAVPNRTRPAAMYVVEIIVLRPTESKSGPRSHGPRTFPAAKGMR